MFTSVLAGLRAGSIDVVMGTSPPIFQAVSAWIVAFLRRKPLLLEVRDLWPAFAIDMGVLRNPLLIALSYWLERFLYARSSHIVVNSPAYRAYLLDRQIASPRISLIPNGVEPEMFLPNSNGMDVRQRYGLESKFIVTYAGALGLANDIPTILSAAKQLRDQTTIHFLLVGDGKERANLEQTVREMGLSNVTFTGALPKREIPQVLAATDVCIAILQDIPMFRTTYPNKVFDYMAAGRPTVLAIDGVIREVIENSKGGVFVQPGNHKALADTLRYLYENPEDCRAKGKAARAFVVEHFDRRRQSQEFIALLENIAVVTSI